MPLHAKATHTKGDEFLIELVNPQAPNGRPLSQSCVMSYGDLIALRDMVERVIEGNGLASVIATDDHTIPAEFKA